MGMSRSFTIAGRAPADIGRMLLCGLGVLLVIVAPAVGVLPGPGGIVVFAVGLALVLKSSHWARRRYVRWKRRWPRLGQWADKGLFRHRRKKGGD